MVNFFKGNPCALPDKIVRNKNGENVNLRDRLHDDWPIGLRWIPRSWNAKGPRCGEGNPGYKKWPPKLIEGYSVMRWQTTGDEKQILIPSFDEKHLTSEYVKDLWVLAVDIKPGSPTYMDQFMVNLNEYIPSTIQKYGSQKGWMKLDCGFQCGWRMITRRETPGKTKEETGEDLVWYWRWGWRCDILDGYYNWGPYAGLNWN